MSTTVNEAFRENARVFSVYGESIADVFHAAGSTLVEQRAPGINGELEDPIVLAFNITSYADGPGEPAHCATLVLSGAFHS